MVCSTENHKGLNLYYWQVVYIICILRTPYLTYFWRFPFPFCSHFRPFLRNSFLISRSSTHATYFVKKRMNQNYSCCIQTKNAFPRFLQKRRFINYQQLIIVVTWLARDIPFPYPHNLFKISKNQNFYHRDAESLARPLAATKFEIRISKYETISNDKWQNTQCSKLYVSLI